MEGVHRSFVVSRGLALARLSHWDCQLIKARDLARGAFNSPLPFAFPSQPPRNQTSPRPLRLLVMLSKNYFHADSRRPRIVSCFHNHTGLPAACLHDWRPREGRSIGKAPIRHTIVHFLPAPEAGECGMYLGWSYCICKVGESLLESGLEIGEEL